MPGAIDRQDSVSFLATDHEVLIPMPSFHAVAKVSDFPGAGKLLVEVDGQLVVLVRCEGAFYAIDDVCTHDGGPLGEGELENCTIACPRHGAKFDVKTGAALTMPATRPTGTHEVKIEGDTVFIQLRQV